MKLTDEQRQRVAEAMGLVVEGERARDSHIAKLAAGIRELALCKVDDAKRSNIQWPGSGDQSSMDAAVLNRFADYLEAK